MTDPFEAMVTAISERIAADLPRIVRKEMLWLMSEQVPSSEDETPMGKARQSVIARLEKCPSTKRELQQSSRPFDALGGPVGKELLASLVKGGDVFVRKEGKRVVYCLAR